MSNFLTEHLIHRDKDFMVIHKAAGLLTVPGKTEDLQDCLISRLMKIEPKTLLIHRLDRDTSGILVFALSREGQKSISRQFQERQTDKTYQAIVAGTLDGEGMVDVPVIYDPDHPPLHIAEPNHNKPALTHWQAIEHFEIQGQAVTRVKLTPITGRSHQLRVHMQYLGHPIIGDTLYATPEQQQLSVRLCLHAERLSFSHPHTQQPVEFYCPAPF
ncbi:RluA family pseudouridine synthase [Acinetobacter bohemicus]|uniref:Dual-specificity RNA pseudouridine synthase RluA n=1 Tax=Acinetobacter lwoffii TaxID=28090 RepID=A0A9D2USW2_ACILW|nr:MULTISPECIES: RluA family pseudouridine synthase [Acinetobacter]MDM1780500.1 RluA family pseudouridine synthase [Acinetobacter indicus]HJF28045.1 RluA family pseudouridine synthase [Acinetobacter lwoffii]MCO8041664.1 RluA family pseudouridine synthase [Acinetobacter sp. S4400-12]MCU7223681.1 RluA family pseudouridine synthase [Acinetobacter bohemicus]QKQ69743.1 RluA family pseudouridine synthase [Acinetobacter sp. 10FS3-1]